MSCKSIIAFMVALLMSASAWAGLGQINLYSQMGQPFRASVALDGLASVANEQVRVGLADQAAFDAQNVDYEPILASLHFSVQPSASGPLVQITSSLPIRSSYLSFVLEVDSPAGRWLRAYTVLLDVSQQTAKPAAAPAVVPAHQQARPLPTRISSPVPVAVSRAQTPIAPSPLAHASVPDASSSPSAEVQALRQQVNRSSSALTAANKHIVDLQNQIKALQALQAQNGFGQWLNFNHFSLRALTGLNGLALVTVVAGALLLLLVLISWWLLRGRARRVQTGAHPLPANYGQAAASSVASDTATGGDPIAEADVYLAYGHNDQAEEILRLGLEREPARQDLRYKLMELYAARPDRVRFEHLAREVYDAYDGRGAMWERARALGQSCDPTNPFYQSDDGLVQAIPVARDTVAGESLVSTDADAELAALLDFTAATPPEVSTSPKVAAADNAMLNFDFSLEDPVVNALNGDAARAGSEAVAVLPVAPAAQVTLDFVAPDLSGVKAEAALQEIAIMIDQVEVVDNWLAQDDDENLSTKLDLARVYLDMGDGEGAREVLQELLQEAKGPLRQQANDMLEKLNN